MKNVFRPSFFLLRLFSFTSFFFHIFFLLHLLLWFRSFWVSQASWASWASSNKSQTSQPSFSLEQMQAYSVPWKKPNDNVWIYSIIDKFSFRSVVVITSASHAEGRRFEPGRKQILSLFIFAQMFLYFLLHFLVEDLLINY